MKPETRLLIVGLGLIATCATFGQPIITTQPQSQTNVMGTDATFTVEATGTQPLIYQWQFNTFELGGRTNATLILTNVQSANVGGYTVVITNVEGAVTSTAATLTVLVPAIISRHPTKQSVSLGATATFSVTAGGSLPLAYQWQFNGADLANTTNRTLSVTNVQLSSAGNYVAVVSNRAGTATSQPALLELDPTFSKITTGSVVNDGGFSIGCAWVDYDDDGYLDLFVTNAAGNNNFLYHNERDGTFRRVTQGEIVNSPRDYRGIAWGDYDNDGHIDLFVTSNGAYGSIGPWNYLFRGNGDGTFTSLSTNIVGDLVGPNGPSENCTWADYDRDGFLDLFVVRYGKDLLFHSNGDGSFTRITNSPVVMDTKDNYAAAWADYDNDGYPDLFVAAAGSGTDGLYHNNTNGTFTRITSGAIATDTADSTGPAWVDYNNDGFPDLFLPNGDYALNLLYRSNGNGTFTKITTGALITGTGLHPNCAWGDYDNDGYLDVFLSNRDRLDNLLYRNNGDGTFTRIISGSLVHDGGNSVKCAWGDYDNDGFLDLFVANGAGDAAENNFLYQNNGNTNQWLKVKLVGTVSNRSAIGAKVRIKARIRGQDMWLLRELSNAAGGPIGSTLIAHFGLGDATNIDTVRIEWPSGTVQEIHDVPAKQFLTIIEPPRLQLAANDATTGARVTLRGGKGFTYALETSDDLAAWLPIGTNTATGLTLEFEDRDATNAPRRFYRARLFPSP